MNIHAYIQEIRQLLLDSHIEAAVEDFPDDPNAYRLAHVRGALLVQYHSAQYSEGGATVQKIRPSFDVYVMCRQLNGASGVYQYIMDVKTALYGKFMSQGGALFPSNESYVSYLNGVWQFVVTFQLITPYYGQQS